MPTHIRRRRPATPVTIVEHEEPDKGEILDISEFLAEHHPNNDRYMRSLEHIQRQIMSVTHQLRPKQVNMLKSVFAGLNFAEAARLHNASPPTVSNLVKSKLGSDLLTALQYHQVMLEGPNLAQRRNMLWRIAQRSEEIDPKITIAAITEVNKMTFAQHAAKTAEFNTQTPNTAGPEIRIPQDLLPAGELDK